MLRRSRFIPALAVAACGLLAASCSAAGPAQSSQAQSSQAQAARTLHSKTTLAAAPGAAGAPLLGFSDARHGWLVVGGITWRTADGGASWIRG
jgi:hypothetical protein